MELINARSIFSPATGFIKRGGFDWTCNPYLGCSFGCLYCYAMFLPQNRRPKEDWGKWFQAKVNAVELARKQAPRVAGQALYLSSVTDPYLPAERSLGLTRGILEALVPHQPRLLVQTRGPLVVRDLDVLKQFRAVRVNMSIPTDSEEVRRAFEPKAPPLAKRWEAIAAAKAAGLAVGICVTPLLPVQDMEAFVERLAAFRPDVLVVQDFHDSGGGFGADTGAAARRLLDERPWTAEDYRRCVDRLAASIHVYEAESGFFPPTEMASPRNRCSGDPAAHRLSAQASAGLHPDLLRHQQ
ncbi:MAG TPA: radical SAM protein [Gemmataceae bacterium]|nr:radical SAM protein [Gemmataceae bacterium]